MQFIIVNENPIDNPSCPDFKSEMFVTSKTSYVTSNKIDDALVFLTLNEANQAMNTISRKYKQEKRQFSTINNFGRKSGNIPQRVQVSWLESETPQLYVSGVALTQVII